MKRKLAFAALMGSITTGIISFTLIRVNTDLEGMQLIRAWMRSWGLAYIVVIPCILILSPLVEKLIDRSIKSR